MERINVLYIHMMKCYRAVTMNELEAYESTQIFKMLSGKETKKCYIQSDNIYPYKNPTLYFLYVCGKNIKMWTGLYTSQL